MSTQGDNLSNARRLPLNLLDAIREYGSDTELSVAMGAEFSSA